jgi:hypothetical protein
LHVEELAYPPVRRYVDVQRERQRMLAIDNVDVDLEQLVERRFLCDRHRCIQWTPHERKADARPLIDNSCCSRYRVPVTDLDRRKLAEILPQVRRRLPAHHPLNVDEAAPPYELDEDYQFVMREQAIGSCQFAVYERGQTHCAIHRTCLEEGLPVWDYKPIGCSLWPLALVEYEREDERRYLLTAYVQATAALFEGGEDETNDEAGFACLVDQDEGYEPLFRSSEGILTHFLGPGFYKKLERAAERHLQRR